jgi:hypothetical protein
MIFPEMVGRSFVIPYKGRIIQLLFCPISIDG